MYASVGKLEQFVYLVSLQLEVCLLSLPESLVWFSFSDLGTVQRFPA